MKKIITVTVCIIIGIIIFFVFNNKYIQSENLECDIKIIQHYNNPLAGRRMYERSKRIN